MDEKLLALMQQQNELLERQNKLFEQLATINISVENTLLPGEQVLVNNLWRDEIRCGFLVTLRRKRLWNIQLNLLAALDRVCRKHNIRYFAFFGTLLGAVRHNGFIPWDDDMDVIMLRPDFEKFKAVVKSEITEPYFVDGWYDYKIEQEESEPPPKSFLQLVKNDQRKAHPLWWPFWPMIKLKDSRTTFAQYLDRPHVHQGIFIDVFPFDPVPPFSDDQRKKIYEMEREMLVAIALPGKIKQQAVKKKNLLISDADLKKFLKLPHNKKAMTLEAFALKNFSRSEFVGQLRDYCLMGREISYAAKNFEAVVYLPFEKIQIPCPVGYEECLTTFYGDWRKLVISTPHSQTYSADFSYKHFFNEKNRQITI